MAFPNPANKCHLIEMCDSHSDMSGNRIALYVILFNEQYNRYQYIVDKLVVIDELEDYIRIVAIHMEGDSSYDRSRLWDICGDRCDHITDYVSTHLGPYIIS